eukprot:3113119-Amphidinium_carterae.1
MSCNSTNLSAQALSSISSARCVLSQPSLSAIIQRRIPNIEAFDLRLYHHRCQRKLKCPGRPSLLTLQPDARLAKPPATKPSSSNASEAWLADVTLACKTNTSTHQLHALCQDLKLEEVSSTPGDLVALASWSGTRASRQANPFGPQVRK